MQTAQPHTSLPPILTNLRNVQGNRRAFCKTMEAVDDALRATPGPFFLESGLSLVDLTFAPFLERIAASMVYYKGFVVRGQVILQGRAEFRVLW